MSYSFRNDNRLPQARLAVVSYVIVGMIGLLLIGFCKLQVIDSDKYSQWADRNRIRSIPVIAPRGRMLDRDGRVLVDNYPSFSVLLLNPSCRIGTLAASYLRTWGGNVPGGMLRTVTWHCVTICASARSTCTLG